MKSNQPGAAIDLIQSILKSCPDDDREALSLQLDEAKSRVASWN